MRQKLYAYIDESGQDTKGDLFVVSVVVLEKDRDKLLQEIELVETESGKRNIKWHKARPVYRQAYIKGLAQIALLEETLYA